MDTRILQPFFDSLTKNDVIKLGMVTDELFQDPDGSHCKLTRKLTKINDLDQAFLEFIGPQLLTISKSQAEEMIQSFLMLPVKEMPLYITENKELTSPDQIQEDSPPPELGPLPWQTLLARWRLAINK